jgi:K+-sensing histidine kinase KdpD
VQSQKLRSSILSSLSHDLRTPLIRLVGLADTLVDTLSDRQTGAPDNAIETAGMLRDQSLAMHRMVTNLLENAAEYSTPGTPIGLKARVCPPNLEVSVCNEGAGFPPRST